MKILYLGYPESEVFNYLTLKGEVQQSMNKLGTTVMIDSFDWIILFGYPHILSGEIIRKARNPILNLHISFLPYNRGASPNFWSWYDNTPKGVSIHEIDEGIDTGNILIQREQVLSESETLRSSYDKLRKHIETLFIQNFDKIVSGEISSIPQKGGGSVHRLKEFEEIKHILSQGWDTPVSYIIQAKENAEGS